MLDDPMVGQPYGRVLEGEFDSAREPEVSFKRAFVTGTGCSGLGMYAGAVLASHSLNPFTFLQVPTLNLTLKKDRLTIGDLTLKVR